MLLIHPPVSKPCEAPAGIARLLGALRGRGIACRGTDLNLSVILRIIEDAGRTPSGDTWTRRALRGREKNLADLRSGRGYHNPDRYGRAATDLNRLLAAAGEGMGARLSFSDYEEKLRSPVRGSDLAAAFERPEESPLYPFFRPELDSLLVDNDFPVIGISLSFLSQALSAFAVAGYLRRSAPRTKLVLGGSLVTSWMRLPDYDSPFRGTFDHLVEGPGEEALVELESSVPRERHPAAQSSVPDIEAFAAPDYADFAELPYLAPGFILPYAASRGCSWKKCGFCPEAAENSPYRPVPPSLALREVAGLVLTTRPALIHFLDNEMSPALLRALAASPPGVPWYGFARVTRELEDPDFCRALGDSGCRMLKLGIESGDPAVLESMGKGVTVEGSSRVLTNLRAAGIETFVYLLFGTPAEGTEEAEKTLDFTVRHADAIGFLNLAIFNLPRGSDMAAGLRTSPFSPGDLSLYSEFVHPRGWNRREVREFLEKRFKRHPAVAPIVRRMPAFFGSNHAPFFPLRKPQG